MVQAAPSGVQNIAEGSLASATSKKAELKLTNVARASLGELMLDCQDFLRQRGLRLTPGRVRGPGLRKPFTPPARQAPGRRPLPHG
jgi:hypothetical protein